MAKSKRAHFGDELLQSGGLRGETAAAHECSPLHFSRRIGTECVREAKGFGFDIRSAAPAGISEDAGLAEALEELS